VVYVGIFGVFYGYNIDGGGGGLVFPCVGTIWSGCCLFEEFVDLLKLETALLLSGRFNSSRKSVSSRCFL